MTQSIPDYIDVDSSDQQKVDLQQLIGNLSIGANFYGWDDLYLKQEIRLILREIGYVSPSAIQKQALPIIFQGKDLLCQARSGMGKTAIFVIGILNQLCIIDENYIPLNCIVMCHTRQLAHQIFKDFRKFSKNLKNPQLRIQCFYGGLSANWQRQVLNDRSKVPHIIIGTPGRIYQLVKQGTLSLHNVQYFVIDECDQILSSPSMRKILQSIFIKIKHPKQVMMFSATLPQGIKREARQFLHNQTDIFVDTGKLVLDGLTQFSTILLESQKYKLLIKLLEKINYNQAIVFVNSIQKARILANLLSQNFYNSTCIHSDLPQPKRLNNYDEFKNNKYKVIVATDLLSRGIDAERVNLIINYDIPHDKDTYLHRIGRAGRFNTKGIAISFICKQSDQNQQNAVLKQETIICLIQQALKKPILQLKSDFDSRKYI